MVQTQTLARGDLPTLEEVSYPDLNLLTRPPLGWVGVGADTIRVRGKTLEGVLNGESLDD